jgi:formylglycine-generating enzyme required for sulfatase activity
MAKTEQERLAVEKQRLELELLKQQAEKEEKEAVRLLRVMMAGMGPEFDALSSRGVLAASPAGIRQDYRMAVLLTKIEVVRSRSSVLSELSDLKELSRLESQAQDLAARHFEGRDPLEITRAKWKELEAWMAAVQELDKVVKDHLAAVPPDGSTKIAGLGELQEIHAQLASLRDDLSARVREFVKAMPDDAMDAKGLFPELAEQAQYDDMQNEPDAIRLDTLAACWVKVADGSEPPGLITECDAALARLQDWFAKHALHQTLLASAATSLQQGDLADAESDVAVLGEARFEDLSYASLEEIAAVQASLAKLQTARRADAIRQAEELLKGYPKSTASSRLRQTAMLHMARGGREKRNVLVVLACLTGLAGLVGIVSFGFYLKQNRIREEAKLKEEVQQREFEGLAREAKEIYLKSTNRGTFVLSPGVPARFSFIGPGKFVMGSPEHEPGRLTFEGEVQVTLTKSFWMAQNEVTQSQWKAVMGGNPSQFQASDLLPVSNVSWEDAQAFIAKLNARKILPEGWRFELPTEAQWEYACRAGSKGPYHGSNLDEIGWHAGNSEGKQHEVGGKKPNSWGLHDMHGNVSEWCLDSWDGAAKLTGGIDPLSGIGPNRVLRGGSWDLALSCRSANRDRVHPGYRNGDLGFRLVVVPVER